MGRNLAPAHTRLIQTRHRRRAARVGYCAISICRIIRVTVVLLLTRICRCIFLTRVYTRAFVYLLIRVSVGLLPN